MSFPLGLAFINNITFYSRITDCALEMCVFFFFSELDNHTFLPLVYHTYSCLLYDRNCVFMLVC